MFSIRFIFFWSEASTVYVSVYTPVRWFMYATKFFSVKSQNAVQLLQSFHEILFSFYLWCALVSFISISPCPLGAFGLSQLSAAARPSTNGLSRLLHNSFADCVARAKGCNGGQETQLLPFVVPRLVFTSFLCPVHSCATALQLHCCRLCSALWYLSCFSRQKNTFTWCGLTNVF